MSFNEDITEEYDYVDQEDEEEDDVFSQTSSQQQLPLMTADESDEVLASCKCKLSIKPLIQSYICYPVCGHQVHLKCYFDKYQYEYHTECPTCCSNPGKILESNLIRAATSDGTKLIDRIPSHLTLTRSLNTWFQKASSNRRDHISPASTLINLKNESERKEIERNTKGLIAMADNEEMRNHQYVVSVELEEIAENLKNWSRQRGINASVPEAVSLGSVDGVLMSGKHAFRKAMESYTKDELVMLWNDADIDFSTFKTMFRISYPKVKSEALLRKKKKNSKKRGGGGDDDEDDGGDGSGDELLEEETLLESVISQHPVVTLPVLLKLKPDWDELIQCGLTWSMCMKAAEGDESVLNIQHLMGIYKKELNIRTILRDLCGYCESDRNHDEAFREFFAPRPRMGILKALRFDFSEMITGYGLREFEPVSYLNMKHLKSLGMKVRDLEGMDTGIVGGGLMKLCVKMGWDTNEFERTFNVKFQLKGNKKK